MITLTKDTKQNFYFDEYNMMLDKSAWPDGGKGDALWRESLATIASNNPWLKAAVNRQCIWVKGKIRFRRHPEIKTNDTSRDQAIMAHIALKEHYYKYYVRNKENLDFRISKKFTWLDAWFWAKEQYLIWRIINFYKFLFIKFDKSYSKHLFCWMIWSSGEKMPLLRKLMIRNTAKTNYLCRVLLCDEFTDKDIADIKTLKPMIDFRWQRDTPWLQGRELTPDEDLNKLDLEVLNYILVKDYGLNIVEL